MQQEQLQDFLEIENSCKLTANDEVKTTTIRTTRTTNHNLGMMMAMEPMDSWQNHVLDIVISECIHITKSLFHEHFICQILQGCTSNSGAVCNILQHVISNLARFLRQWLEFWLWRHAVAWIQSSIFFLMSSWFYGSHSSSEILRCDDIKGSTSFLVDWLFFVGKGSYLSTAWILGRRLGVYWSFGFQVNRIWAPTRCRGRFKISE